MYFPKDVTINAHQKNRSLEQNKYMWAIYDQFINERN